MLSCLTVPALGRALDPVLEPVQFGVLCAVPDPALDSGSSLCFSKIIAWYSEAKICFNLVFVEI